MFKINSIVVRYMHNKIAGQNQEKNILRDKILNLTRLVNFANRSDAVFCYISNREYVYGVTALFSGDFFPRLK